VPVHSPAAHWSETGPAVVSSIVEEQSPVHDGMQTPATHCWQPVAHLPPSGEKPHVWHMAVVICGPGTQTPPSPQAGVQTAVTLVLVVEPLEVEAAPPVPETWRSSSWART
jgi:hypothetical protein